MESKHAGFMFILVFAVGLVFSGQIRAESSTMPDPQPVFETGFMDVEGGKIYYESAGEGDVIVFVHDGSLHSVVWDDEFFVFAKNYRVVRYDRRGYGKSTYPEVPFSNVEDLNALFRFLDVKKAAVIGMSAGGGLAVDFTLAYPEKVTSLVLVGAVVSGYRYSDHFLSRGGRLRPADMSNPGKLIDYMFKEDPYTIYSGNKETRRKAWKIMKENPHNYDFRRNRFIRPPDRPALGALNEIQVPTLIVVGEYDIPDVHAHAGVLETDIKNAERVIVRDSAHLVPLEKPTEFNSMVEDFLESAPFLNVIYTEGPEEAVRRFKKWQEEGRKNIPFKEEKINRVGYNSLAEGKTRDAIELFKLNVLAFPDSWNAYDSLAEAYMQSGDRDNAIKFYKKSLELNPENTNAADRLERLKKRIK